MIFVLPGPVLCDHGRLSDGCEDCALRSALERGYVHPRTRNHHPHHPPETAAHDLYLDRGEGRYVLVNAGDPIPGSMADLPRIPRIPPAAQESAGDKPAARKRGA